MLSFPDRMKASTFATICRGRDILYQAYITWRKAYGGRAHIDQRLRFPVTWQDSDEGREARGEAVKKGQGQAR